MTLNLQDSNIEYNNCLDSVGRFETFKQFEKIKEYKKPNLENFEAKNECLS